MSEPYTPTDEEMRAFCTAERLDGPHLSGFPTPTVGEAEAEFDRWLAEHDRQVAERAWDEGQKAGLAEANDLRRNVQRPRLSPYRAAKGEQK